MDISWAFNGVPIDTSKDASITVTRISKHLSTLSIDGVSARHAGEYACSASNLAGSVSRSATLTVNGTTYLFNKRVSYRSTLHRCDSVSFRCEQDHVSPLSHFLPKRSDSAFHLHHRHTNPVVCSSSRRRNSEKRSTANRHSYRSPASLPPSLSLSSRVFPVEYFPVAPQILPFAFGDEPASWGELVSVTCSVAKGDQPLEISWAFNGTPIDSHHGSDVVIGSTNKKNSVLTIESVAARHAGEYTCSASNRAGATTHSSRLTVNGTCVHDPFRVLLLRFSVRHTVPHLSTRQRWDFL